MTSRAWRPWPPSASCGSTWMAPTAGQACSRPSVRSAYAGIEHADSFVVDPHKWLFAPFDCAALVYRDPALARSVHRQDASYLDVIHEQPGRVESRPTTPTT